MGNIDFTNTPEYQLHLDQLIGLSEDKTCPICNYRTEELREHITESHDSDIIEVRVDELMDDGDWKDDICPICGRVFTQHEESNIYYHISADHSQKEHIDTMLLLQHKASKNL